MGGGERAWVVGRVGREHEWWGESMGGGERAWVVGRVRREHEWWGESMGGGERAWVVGRVGREHEWWGETLQKQCCFMIFSDSVHLRFNEIICFLYFLFQNIYMKLREKYYVIQKT